MIRLDNDWEFTEQWSEEFAQWKTDGTPVRLPHTNRMLGLHYIDPHDYEMI